MDVVQQLPSEASPSGDIARSIARILGTAYQPADGTVAAAHFLGLGDIFNDTRNVNVDSINEAFANTANQLLSRYESVFGIATDPALTVAAREARVVAKIQALRAGTPQSIKAAVNQLLAGGASSIVENLASVVNAMVPPQPRLVFLWALVIAATDWSNPATFASVLATINQMKPAHTLGNITTRVGFRCDDPLSLTDRDLLRI